MIRLLLIHSYLFAALWHGVMDSLPTTAWDDCRSYAYNHGDTVFGVPDSLWTRLEEQAQREGQSAEEFICQRQPWSCEEE